MKDLFETLAAISGEKYYLNTDFAKKHMYFSEQNIRASLASSILENIQSEYHDIRAESQNMYSLAVNATAGWIDNFARIGLNNELNHSLYSLKNHYNIINYILDKTLSSFVNYKYDISYKTKYLESDGEIILGHELNFDLLNHNYVIPSSILTNPIENLIDHGSYNISTLEQAAEVSQFLKPINGEIGDTELYLSVIGLEVLYDHMFIKNHFNSVEYTGINLMLSES